MSRSIKHIKAPGYEYWGKRPVSRNHGATPGRYSKNLTHRLERLEAKEEIRSAIQEDLEDTLTCTCLDDFCRGECWMFNIKEEHNK